MEDTIRQIDSRLILHHISTWISPILRHLATARVYNSSRKLLLPVIKGVYMYMYVNVNIEYHFITLHIQNTGRVCEIFVN